MQASANDVCCEIFLLFRTGILKNIRSSYFTIVCFIKFGLISEIIHPS